MIVVEMKKHFQLRAIEWWSAGVMASWGLWVLLFPGMFDENPAFDALEAMAPQQVWGCVALVAGGLRLFALLVNGLWHRTPAVRWMCAMTSVLVWFLITSAFAGSNTPNVGVIIYGWHMLADMYSAFRSASDYVEAEAQRRLEDITIATLPRDKDNVRSFPARVG